ncbi:MAG: AIPR family protein [Microcystaceae cyanobacterium]
MESVQGLPAFLQSLIYFTQHIEELYEDLSNVDKGKKFAELVRDTLSSQDDFWGLEAMLNPKQSYDEGIDLFWINPESRQKEIFCQSKFKMKSKDDLDNVISKFKAFEDSQNNPPTPQQLSVFSTEDSIEKVSSRSKTKYFVVTLTKLGNIINSYEKSGRPSLEFYNSLLSQKRLEIVDGEIFYGYFLDSYQKEYSIPQEIRFKADQKLINKMNVHVGIIDSQDLINIYRKSGNGIFFENVRDFIGLGNKNKDSTLDINSEIYKTAHDEPSKMIERNNGITFKASSIEYDGDFVVLKNAGIINGCQTTLCIVKAEPSELCYVPVKIVTTSDDQNSSDIARTANTQNRIDKINLELSDFIRPQLIKISLAEAGISLIESEMTSSAPRIAAIISNQKIFKSDLRFLFIGLFSITPRNIFTSDYAAIRFDDLKIAYSSVEQKKNLNSLLAKLIICTNSTFDSLRVKYPMDAGKYSNTYERKVGKVFNRFYADQKSYKIYLVILAIYCLINIEDEKQIKKLAINELVNSIQTIIEDNDKKLDTAIDKIFRSVALSAVQHFAKDEDFFDSKEFDKEISQYLSQYVARTPLTNYFLSFALIGLN